MILNIKIYDGINLLVSLKNIKFTNFGFKKNIVEGDILGKKFRSKNK